MPGSILAVCYDTSTGRYLVQKAGSAQIADEAITSAKLGLLAVGTPHIADENVTSAKLTSAIIGLLGTVADEAITSAKLASGAVGGVHILDGSIGGVDLADLAVVSAKIGTTEVGTPHLAALAVTEAKIGAGAVTSGKIGTGIIGDTLVKDYGIISGKVASGSITEQALASGISIDIAEIAQEPSYRAEQLISAYLGVQFSISGYFNYAQAAAIGTMPAVGLAIANIASGAIGTFQHAGRISNPAWDFSGYVGNLLFLGTSSQVTLTAPSTSGECVQRIGKIVDKDTIFVRPELTFVQIAE